MRSLFSIAIVTLRDAARSKLALALAVVLTLLATLLPFALTGDGTPGGQARITLQYTLTIAMLVLSFVSVWMASSSISSDIRTRTLQLVRVKPVRMWKLWVGKWLAFLFLDGALLAGFLLLLWGRIALGNGGAVFRHADHGIRPELPTIQEQADRTYRNAIAGQRLSAEELRAIRSQIRAQIPFATATLSRGETWRWEFRLLRPARPGERIRIRAHFDSDAMTRDRISVSCRLHPVGREESVPFRMDDLSSREVIVPLDIGTLEGATRLILEIRHDGADGAGPIMVQPRQNLVLLQQAGPFPCNLLRTYLVLLSVLSALIAIGLSFGALFTFPVAVFCSICLLLSVLVGRYAATDPDILAAPEGDVRESPVETLTRTCATITSHTLTYLSQPALGPSPVSDLSEGEWIDTGELLRSLYVNLFFLPALFSLGVSFPLSRKELPE